MALDLLTSTVERAHIVLDIDPDVRAANSQAALDAYRESSDIGDLEVPDGATVFEVRALSRSELKAVEASAGRRSDLGAQLFARADKAGMVAALARYGADVREAIQAHLGEGVDVPAKLDDARALLDDEARGAVERVGVAAFSIGYGDGYARAVEALDDREELALRRFAAWRERYQLALCGRSLCAIEGIRTLQGGVPAVPDADGVFPFELFLSAYEGHAARAGQAHAGAVLLRQLAHHCEQVSRLGKGGRRRCGSPPGTTTTTPPLTAGGVSAPVSSAAATQPSEI